MIMELGRITIVASGMKISQLSDKENITYVLRTVVSIRRISTLITIRTDYKNFCPKLMTYAREFKVSVC